MTKPKTNGNGVARDRRSVARKNGAKHHDELKLELCLPGRLARWATRRARTASLPLDAWLLLLVTRERQREAGAELRRLAGQHDELLQDAGPRDAAATASDILTELLGEAPEPLIADG